VLGCSTSTKASNRRADLFYGLPCGRNNPCHVFSDPFSDLGPASHILISHRRCIILPAKSFIQRTDSAHENGSCRDAERITRKIDVSVAGINGGKAFRPRRRALLLWCRHPVWASLMTVVAQVATLGVRTYMAERIVT